jgi:hypothetical protein
MTKVSPVSRGERVSAGCYVFVVEEAVKVTKKDTNFAQDGHRAPHPLLYAPIAAGRAGEAV